MSNHSNLQNTVKKPFLTKKKNSQNWYIVTTSTATRKRSYQSTRTPDKAEAETLLRELETSLGVASKETKQAEHIKNLILGGIERTTQVVIQSKTPLDMIWQEYTKNERVRALKPSTLNGNRDILNVFLRFIQSAGVQYAEQINYEVAQAYLGDVRARGRSDGTLTNHRHCLHGIFKRVKRPLNMEANPFADVEAPFRPQRETHRCFKSEELQKLLGIVSPEWKIVITLSYYTGLRFGDCCQFQLDFIEWEKDAIVITPAKTERYDKEIIIPLHPALKKAFKAYTNAQEGFLVPEFAEQQGRKSVNLAVQFRALLGDLGIEKETEEGILDFHSLRHTFNTNLANGNVDIGTRMKLTGHSSIEMNQLYNHAIEPLRSAISCIPEIK